MSSPVPVPLRKVQEKIEGVAASPDVAWLLSPKKESGRARSSTIPKDRGNDTTARTHSPLVQNAQTPPQSPVDSNKQFAFNEQSPRSTGNEAAASPTTKTPERQEPQRQSQSSVQQSPSPTTQRTAPQSPRQAAPPQQNNENEGKKSVVGNLKKESGSRRSSWMASLSSKFSSSSDRPTAQRSASHDSSTVQRTQGPQSPKMEFGDPFHRHKNENQNDATKNMKVVPVDPKSNKKGERVEQKIVVTPVRRPSVLVAAGKETKLEEKSFLSSAFRRLSSSGGANMGKEATRGAIQPRRVMNIDQNRERVKISEFDLNKLKRVAFCVDVEIAGYAAQGDEEEDDEPQMATRPPVSSTGQRGSLSMPVPKESKDAKYKEKGEGNALRNPEQAPAEKDTEGSTKVDVAMEATSTAVNSADKHEVKPEDQKQTPSEPQQTGSQPVPIPSTRKREKKKLSEEQRKARKERKLRHAQANGLIPLEIMRHDDSDMDSTPSSTPPGSSTPSKVMNLPTTDPLRIYKRCCQLRETSPLSRIKEQISKPSHLVAEAQGTVAVVDLTGLEMPLHDIATLGDWLAVVPVRKLVLDDCNLSDEGVRIILSGLAGCKSTDQAKANRKLPARPSGKKVMEQMCVIERLSLKNNSSITNLGWKHIALFMHMSKSLRAIDLTGIPFPRTSGDLSRSTTTSSNDPPSTTSMPANKPTELGSLIARAISERVGNKLEELIFSSCKLSTENVIEIVDCAIKCKVRRLGLANNDLSNEALNHVVTYLKAGVSEGLDLGSNDLHGRLHPIASVIEENNPLFAVSFSDCNLHPQDLKEIFVGLSRSQQMKFMDVSNNHELFDGKESAIPVLRKYLPQMKVLKRIHLSNCAMTPNHAVALADILPDCPALVHISILENEVLVDAMNSDNERQQEEACAFLAALMTAVRISATIIAIEVEVPSAESSEVVKALASQIVAYSLKNMEASTLNEYGVKSNSAPDKDTPEVLMHLVGGMETRLEHDTAADEQAPDENYIVASTGIVKALGVCLGTGDGNSQVPSRGISPSRSGYSTPRHGLPRPKEAKKPRDVSLELCESARKIRMRLRPALVKEDRAGNDFAWRRLVLLDQTLERMIQRFEDEYPQTKVGVPASAASIQAKDFGGAALADSIVSTASDDEGTLEKVKSLDESLEGDTAETGRTPLKLSRSGSNTSLAAKAKTDEEGRMHRIGQTLKREFLKPGALDQSRERKSMETGRPEQLTDEDLELRQNYMLTSQKLQELVDQENKGDVVHRYGINIEDFKTLQDDDPETFEKLRDSQIAAQINTGAYETKSNGVKS